MARRVVGLLLATLSFGACGRATSPEWRGFGMTDWPEGWSLDGDAIVLEPTGERVDLVSAEVYADFELRLDYELEPGGNSGIFFRVSEDVPEAWGSGPELQILDDDGQTASPADVHRAGACYDLYAPTMPSGRTASVRLVVDGERVEHWLNDTMVVTYEIGSADWARRVAGSKFASLPRFGREPVGHVVLQDHGERVRFENVEIVAR